MKHIASRQVSGQSKDLIFMPVDNNNVPESAAYLKGQGAHCGCHKQPRRNLGNFSFSERVGTMEKGNVVVVVRGDDVGVIGVVEMIDHDRVQVRTPSGSLFTYPLSDLDSKVRSGTCSTCGKLFDRAWAARISGGADAENGPCESDPIDHAYQDECEECQDAAYYAADEGRDA